MIVSRCGRASWALASWASALLVIAGGCSGRSAPSPRFPVTGQVLIDGTPLSKGAILMEGEADAATGLVPAVADIENGTYSLLARAGRMRVRFMAPEEYGSVDGTGERPTRETVAAEFNSASTLFVEVMADGTNRFDFEVRSR